MFCSMVGIGKDFGDWIGLFDIKPYFWLCTSVYYVGTMERLGNENLLCSKPPIPPPNRLANPDLRRLSCDSLNVLCDRKNCLFNMCWMLSMQVSEPEHPITSEVENVVGICRFLQKELKVV